MAAFLDNCRFNPTLGGTTDWTYSSAVAGYQSPTAAGAVTTTVYEVFAIDASNNWEISRGACTITAGVPTFARTTVLYNSAGTGTATGQSGAGTKISFAAAPQVAVIAIKGSLLSIEEANSFTATQRAQARTNISAALKGQIFGLTLSTAGASATFGIAAGEAADSTGVALMALASAYTKTTGAWAVGTGNGSLDTGTIANNTSYHAYLIERLDTGVVDICTSLSGTAPTFGVNIPAAYTISRFVGSMKTNGSAQWTKFIQDGDDFWWDVPVADVNTVQNPGTAAVTRTLSVPTGRRVQAIISALAQTNGTAATPGAFLISDLSVADTAASASAFSVYVYSGSLLTLLLGAQSKVYTNTSGQVRTRLQTSNTDAFIYINTHGWTDRRGRDA